MNLEINSRSSPKSIVIFCHSLVSDWNHGNAHFLRGVVSELISKGHNVRVYEPKGGWSRRNLLAEHGDAPIRMFNAAYPGLKSIEYDPKDLDLGLALDGADLVIVHEWNDPELVRRIGKYRAGGSFRLLFHDTHHRSVTDPESITKYDLSNYDGVLAFGSVIRDIYLSQGWAQRAWTWHEAADTRIFHPVNGANREGDVVWVGNWGDDERTAELREFLLEPVRELGLRARVYGVRYPDYGKRELARAGIEYGGWVPNYEVPKVFAKYRLTVHVPRRPYTQNLPGIPTIRVFEALACGIPLVCAPWDDIEMLFEPGRDFIVAANGKQMKQHMRVLLQDIRLARSLAEHGRNTVLTRHTCAHRVDELLRIYEECASAERPAASRSSR